MAIPNQIEISNTINNVSIQSNNNQVSVVNESRNIDISILQPAVNVIQVSTPGPAGPAGSAPIINTGSFATTGSNNFVGNQTITGSLNITGDITGTFSGSFQAAGPTGSIQFNSSGSISGSSLLVYDSSLGRVNIGTTMSIVDNGIRLHVGHSRNGSSGILITNSNSGSSAGAQLLIRNDAGFAAQWFAGSSNSAYGNNTLFLRQIANGEFRLVTDTAGQTFYFGNSLFGANPYARIGVSSSFSGNVGVGMTGPTSRLQVRGSGATLSSTALRVENSNSSASLVVLDDGNVGIGTNTPTTKLVVNSTTTALNTTFNELSTATIIGSQQSPLRVLRPAGQPNIYIGTSNETPNHSSFLAAFRTGAWYNTSTPTYSGQFLFHSVERANDWGAATSAANLRMYQYFTCNGNNARSALSIIPLLVESATNTDYVAVNNLLVTTAGGFGIQPTARVQIVGDGLTSATAGLRIENSNATASMVVLDNGFVGVGTNTPVVQFTVSKTSGNTEVDIESLSSTHSGILYFDNNQGRGLRIQNYGSAATGTAFGGLVNLASTTIFRTNSEQRLLIGGTTNTSLFVGGTNNITTHFDNTNHRVGIGLINPTSRLQVRGSGTTSSTTALRIENSNSQETLQVRDDGVLKNYITGSSYPALETYVEGIGSGIKLSRQTDGFVGRIFWNSTYTFPDNGGNLVFGSLSSGMTHAGGLVNLRTTQPQLTMMSNTNGGKGFYEIAPTASNSYELWLHDNFNQQNRRLTLGFANNGDLSYYQSGSVNTLFFVSQSGNVGIGKTTPNATLDILGNAIITGSAQITGSLGVIGSGFILNPSNFTAGLSIVSPPTAGGSLVLSTVGGPGINNGAYLILRQSDGTFPNPTSTGAGRVISTQDSQYFNGTSYITSTKIIDISEGQKIFGVTPSFGGTLTYYGKLSNGNWYFGDLSSTLNTARDTSVSARVQIKGSGATSSTTALRVENLNASASLTVLDNGNVGIGTNTPTSLLQIGSGSGFLGDFTTPAITFNNLNNGIYLDANRINFKAGGGFSFGADSNGPLGNGFRINAALFDNLTTPIFVASRLSLGINSGYGGNNAGHLSLITSGSSRIYVDYLGNVGIGTTNPTTKLHIIGNEYTLAAETVSDINFYTTPGVSRHFNFYNIRQDSDFNFKQNVGGILGTTTFIIKGNSGNVGIGTTNPTFRLDVSGSARLTSGSQLRIDDSTGGNYTRIQNRLIVFSRTNGTSEAVSIDGSSDNQLNVYARSGLTLRGGGSAVNVMVINDEGGAAGNASVLITGTSTGPNSGSLQVRNSSNTQVFKTFDGGSVAVGTITTPTARLQVKGSGALSSTIALRVENNNSSASLVVRDDGNVGIGGDAINGYKLRVYGSLWATSLDQLSILNGSAGVGVIGFYDAGSSLRLRVYGPHPSEAVKGILALDRQDLSYTTLANSIPHTASFFMDHPSFVIRSNNTSANSFFLQNYMFASGALFVTNQPAGGDTSFRFRPSASLTDSTDVFVINTAGVEVIGSGRITGSLTVTNGITGSIFTPVSGTFVLPLTSSVGPNIPTGSAYWSGSFLFIWDGVQYRSSSFS